MSKKSLIVGAILLALAGVLLWLSNRQVQEPLVTSSPKHQKAVPALAEKKRKEEIEKMPPGSRIRRIMEDPQADWKTPIRYYGKVVDENRKPVEGANIGFLWNDTSPQGTSKSETKSDAEGLFSLTGVKGKGVSVWVQKDSYYTSQEQNQFSFEMANENESEYYKPDPNNPVIFHLRKKGEAESLIYHQTFFGFKTDGSPGYLDLVEGKNRKDRSGDISVRLVRGAENEQRRFNWSVIFEAMDGGLSKSSDEFMFLAPENGYESAMEIRQSKDDPKWQREVKQKFYIKSRQGKCYARIEATIIPRYNDQAAINMTYYVNPNGSRNLEYDPAKEIKPSGK